MNLDELLLTVQKPGRYVGGEWNSIRKDWSADRVRFLLAFPDVYEIGMSNLGLKILYGILNERDDCLCERVFSPWPDLEKALRDNGHGIFSLESRRPMKDFDIVGFSLAYELAFTNVLNLMDLGGIPVMAADRGDDDPLIIAGGPCCCNPEPMSDFIDAFLIGDGEEAVLELMEAYKSSKLKYKTQNLKKDLLGELAKIKGVYVPSFYNVEYNDDRTIKSFSAIDPRAPQRIEKRIVEDLDGCYYPVAQIVPNIQIVHDRLAIEIMRGCKNGCKFCQAVRLYGPCRERSVERIVDIARRAYDATGFDEVSLLSLSSGDYGRIKDLLCALNDIFSRKSVSISVPSLRAQARMKEIPGLVSKVKKSGLTFAPEAGSEKMRRRINKNIRMEDLLDAALESFRNGWKRVKLYFMIGLPDEAEDDIAAIPELITEISRLKIKVDGRPAQIAVSINAFVPKPHTPFERDAMDTLESLEAKRARLLGMIKPRMAAVSFHPFAMGRLEAALSRGDRRIGRAIYRAWLSGARFDGWGEAFNADIWTGSFAKSGIDPDFYFRRMRGNSEILPWDFISPV